MASLKTFKGASRSRAAPWVVIALLWFAAFSNYLIRLLPTTMHGSIVAAMPMSEAQFGLLTSSLFWTYGMMSPFCGFLADRFNRSRVIVISMFVWSTVTWLTSYTRTFEQLFILRSLMGIAEACYFPAATALICDYHTGPTRSLAICIHQSGVVIGMGLSGLGGWLAEQRSWHFAFSLVGLVGIAYSGVLLLFLRDAPREGASAGAAQEIGTREEVGIREAGTQVRAGDAFKSLFASGAFILVLAVTALQNAVFWPALGWMPVYLQEHFHLTQGVAGLSATGYMNIAAVPGLLIGGLWADRWSRGNPRGRMYVASIGLLISAPGILLTANAGLLKVALLGLIINCLFCSFFSGNVMPVLCEVVDRRYRATSYGLVNFFGSLAAGAGIYFPGVLRDLKFDLHTVFDVAAAGLVACAVLMFFIKPRKFAAA